MKASLTRVGVLNKVRDIVGYVTDDEIVALSAGITSTMDSEVNTTIDHRRIVRDGEFAQFVGTEEGVTMLEKAAFENKYENAQWVNMQGHAGFVMLEKNPLYVNRYNSEECAGQPFFEIGISHGKNPVKKSYAYAILPHVTNDKLIEYYANPDVEIISNTEDIQAVREKNLRISAYAFHRAGKCEEIEVSEPMLAVACDNGDTVEISVSDLTHELAAAEVTIFGAYDPVECNSKIVPVVEDGKVILKVDFALANGRAYRTILKKKNV